MMLCIILHPFNHPVILVVPYQGRSLWILTVWWWLLSLSAAGRWSDLLSRWSNPPHSWESKPSGSTRLPLQQGRGNRKSKRATAVYFVFTSERAEKTSQQAVSIISLFEPLPSCLPCFYFFSCIHNKFFLAILTKSWKQLCLIQYMDHIVGLSVNCEEEATCLSVITVWQNRCEPVLHHYAKAE